MHLDSWNSDMYTHNKCEYMSEILHRICACVVVELEHEYTAVFMMVVLDLPMSDHYRFTVKAHAHSDLNLKYASHSVIQYSQFQGTLQASFLAAKCLQRIQSIFDGGLCGPISPKIQHSPK